VDEVWSTSKNLSDGGSQKSKKKREKGYTDSNADWGGR